jgi:hypothetical protein
MSRDFMKSEISRFNSSPLIPFIPHNTFSFFMDRIRCFTSVSTNLRPLSAGECSSVHPLYAWFAAGRAAFPAWPASAGTLRQLLRSGQRGTIFAGLESNPPLSEPLQQDLAFLLEQSVSREDIPFGPEAGEKQRQRGQQGRLSCYFESGSCIPERNIATSKGKWNNFTPARQMSQSSAMNTQNTQNSALHGSWVSINIIGCRHLS